MAKTLTELKLSDLLPSSIVDDSNVSAAASALDPELQSIAEAAGLLPFLSRIDELAEEWLDQLAWQWHVDAYEPLRLPIDHKRAIVKTALIVHRYKGTAWAVKKSLEALGYPSRLIEDAGTPYVFDLSVQLNSGADIAEVSQIAAQYVNAVKPASRHLGHIIHHMDSSGEISIAASSYGGTICEVWPLGPSDMDTGGGVYKASATLGGEITLDVGPAS